MADIVEDLKEQGFVILRGCLNPEDLTPLQGRYEQVVDEFLSNLKKEGALEDTGQGLPFETRLWKAGGEQAKKLGRSWRSLVVGPEIYDLYHVPNLVDSMEALLPGPVIGHPIFNARPKLPGQELTVVPWHQDIGYFGKETLDSFILTAWIPLVPVDADNGALQVVPGSHKKGWLEHRDGVGEGEFLEIKESIKESDAVTCAMKPGDVLVFSHMMVHRSLPNNSQGIRWSIDLRYIRDGDFPGNNAWTDSSHKWVLRSEKESTTPKETWLSWAKQLPW